MQSLTRHSTIGILIDRYGHTAADRRTTAVQSRIPTVIKNQNKKDST